MNKICICNLELNNWNGFTFSILDIEYKSFEGELLGLHFGNKFLTIGFLFLSIEVHKFW